MIRFCDDYSEGCHEEILKLLQETSRTQSDTYGLDSYTKRSESRIRELVKSDSAVHFLIGGTQANLILISSVLRPYQAVLSADTGHIAVHETGAVEGTGHKVISIPSTNGKIRPDQVMKAFQMHYSDPTAEHMPQPAMLYISHPTEVGTLYSLEELKAFYQICHEFHAVLYVDGARLGCALTSPHTDITLEDLGHYTDAFTIGGTKMGAMFGEAMVINQPSLNHDFRYMIKHHGGLLAKGRLLGIQFEALLNNDLYFELGRHANKMAFQLAKGIQNAGYLFRYPVQSNQIFPILPASLLESMRHQFVWSSDTPMQNGMVCIRLCTSWATPQENIDLFLSAIYNWKE